ncbi:hypothetical protein MTP04_16130 [Lysinibacillus sp. PLM2]|nr:hypothetical protein MTP04_16130 [Lysinibacillus sp. PLM2]
MFSQNVVTNLSIELLKSIINNHFIKSINNKCAEFMKKELNTKKKDPTYKKLKDFEIILTFFTTKSIKLKRRLPYWMNAH